MCIKSKVFITSLKTRGTLKNHKKLGCYINIKWHYGATSASYNKMEFTVLLHFLKNSKIALVVLVVLFAHHSRSRIFDFFPMYRLVAFIANHVYLCKIKFRKGSLWFNLINDVCVCVCALEKNVSVKHIN